MRYIIIIIIISILTSLSVQAEITNKGKIRKFLIKTQFHEFHDLIKKQSIDKIDLHELSDVNREKFYSFIESNYKSVNIEKYIVEEISFSFTNKELTHLTEIYDGLFFNKMMRVLFSIYKEDKQDDFIEYLKDKKTTFVKKRVKQIRSIIKNSSVDQSSADITSTLGKTFFIQFNDHLKFSGLSKLELNLVFWNMDEKQREEIDEKLIKLLYFKTKQVYLSEVQEFSRLVKDKTYQKFMNSITEVVTQYYESYVEDANIKGIGFE
jgi:hypothetical protein